MTKFQLIAGTSDPRQWAAISFVHSLGRIHVAPADVISIEAHEFFNFTVEGKARRIRSPHVAIELAAPVCEQLYALTSAIMESDQAEAPLSIWVGRICVTQPILREPVGASSIFHVAAPSIEEARGQAEVLKSRLNAAVFKVVRSDQG